MRFLALNESWNKFLSESGAVFANGRVQDFGDPAAEQRAAAGAGVICDLSQHGLIAIEGQDAFTFLQGQLTCDMNEISPSRSRLGAWCSPKGRVLVLFRVVHLTNGMLLQLPASQIEETIKRLRMYVLRSRVSLKDVSDEFVRIGLTGESATKLLQSRYGSAPRSPDDVVAMGNDRLIRLHGVAPRYQFIGESAHAADLWRAAAGTLTPAGAQAWTLLEILAGVPEIGQSDQHLPQMINLDLLDAVSFNKGCFVGQEIIARTHHLGRLKRRMYLLSADVTEGVEPGAPILAAASGSEAAGQIVSSARRVDGNGVIALAVLRIDAAKSGDLRFANANGPRVQLLELPYSIPDLQQ